MGPHGLIMFVCKTNRLDARRGPKISGKLLYVVPVRSSCGTVLGVVGSPSPPADIPVLSIPSNQSPLLPLLCPTQGGGGMRYRAGWLGLGLGTASASQRLPDQEKMLSIERKRSFNVVIRPCMLLSPPLTQCQARVQKAARSKYTIKHLF